MKGNESKNLPELVTRRKGTNKTLDKYPIVGFCCTITTTNTNLHVAPKNRWKTAKGFPKGGGALPPTAFFSSIS